MTAPLGRTGASPPSENPQSTSDGYTVQRGDTLGAIARAHGVTVEQLVAANPQLPALGTDPGRIRPGWELVIPSLRARTTAEHASGAWASTNRPVDRERVSGSMVRPGDLGNRLAAGGAQSIALNMKAHEDAIDRTGVGRFYGDHSSFKTMSEAEKREWVKSHATAGTDPAMPKESSCIGWAFENVGAAYRAAGKEARWSEIMATVTRNGSKGTDLAKELKKDGWQAVYWNPDARHPADANTEHSFSAAQVAKGKPYYGIEIDHVVENYRPTPGHGTTLDESGIKSLEKVPFFFGLARGGTHTFVGRAGKVNEFHWDQLPDSKHAIEETPLQQWGWNSGVIMVPPGTWPTR